MNAYRAYDVIEERKWAEQLLTEEKEKWIDDWAKRSLTAFRMIPTRHYASLHRPRRFHMKASVAIKLARYTTICAQQ